jgi:hypothetical protein
MAAESLNWNLDKFEQRYRLTMHDERSAEIHQAFLTLGCVLICWNTLTCPVLIGAIPRRACARTTKRTWRDQANVPHSIEWSSQVALPVDTQLGAPATGSASTIRVRRNSATVFIVVTPSSDKVFVIGS